MSGAGLESMDALQERWAAGGPRVPLCELEISGCRIRLRGNDPELAAPLRRYFRPYLAEASERDAIEVLAIEREAVTFDLDWVDWPREAGKSGLKERYHDLPGGRLVWKVRTGMTFLLAPRRVVALGPCLANLNQLINLVNNQVIARLMGEGHELCHAAGVRGAAGGIGLAGVSGAGKSTLALRLIERGADFVSNDRLLVRREGAGVQMRGIPKMPRVNPGTLLSLPSLTEILPPERRAALLELPRQELWDLEEKYDVDVEAVYGAGRVASEAPLTAFVVLTWDPRSDAGAEPRWTTLAREPELLAPIEKHPGPFFQSGGVYDTRGSVSGLPPEPYLEVLGDVPLLVIAGGVDFDAAVKACEAVLASPR